MNYSANKVKESYMLYFAILNTTRELQLFLYLLHFLRIFILINWFILCHQVVTSEVTILPRDGRNHLWYWLHLPKTCPYSCYCISTTP